MLPLRTAALLLLTLPVLAACGNNNNNGNSGNAQSATPTTQATGQDSAAAQPAPGTNQQAEVAAQGDARAATGDAKGTPVDNSAQPDAPTAAPALAPYDQPPAGSAKTPQVLYGKWAEDLARCTDPAAVTTISASSFETGTNSCDLEGITPNGDSFTATINCGATGQKTSDVVRFTPAADGGLALVYPNRNNQTTNLKKCG